MNAFKQQLLRYWIAMNASAVQSMAHAGKAWLATAAAHAASKDAIPALDVNQFGAVLAFAFVLEIFNWLGANPLPAYVSASNPPTPPTQ